MVAKGGLDGNDGGVELWSVACADDNVGMWCVECDVKLWCGDVGVSMWCVECDVGV